MDSKTIRLNKGSGFIPVVGLGTFTFFGEKGSDSEVEDAVCAAIDAGYRHIDTAWSYNTQEAIGKALEKKISEGVVKREDLFIVTKLWNSHHNPDIVMKELKCSLDQLKTSYVDLFLIHWPTSEPDEDLNGNVIAQTGDKNQGKWPTYKLEDVWKAMEDCHKAGLTRNIGLSNFNCKQIDRILNCATTKPSCNQIESSPHLTNEHLTKFCQDKGLVVVIYSPLGSPNSPWRTDDPSIFEDPVMLEIAKRHHKSVAQVAIRFQIQRGNCVLVKSVKPPRIRENIDVFDFELSEVEMAKIKALNRNLRIYEIPWADIRDHPEYPFNETY